MSDATGFAGAARRRVSGRRWRVTRTLPLGVAIAMFVVTLGTTQVGLRVLDTRELEALAGRGGAARHSVWQH